MIEILASTGANSVQDRGRVGWLSSGVARSGAMDRLALDAANLLVGNPLEAAGLEIAGYPFGLRVAVDCLLAVTGAVAEVTLSGRRLPPWWSTAAKAGDELRIDPPREGARVYVALSGGIDVPLLMGSRSTELKSGFGGSDGRALRRGDRLALHPARSLALPPGGIGLMPPEARRDRAAPIRLLAGAEWAEFGEEARRSLIDADWIVSTDLDRQGCRLDGPALVRNGGRELLSHGIVPGTVQVPPSGRPVIQLAEANTCGGYAKIAAVIDADLWRLGQVMPGDRLRFELIPRAAAVAAERAATDWVERAAASLAVYRNS